MKEKSMRPRKPFPPGAAKRLNTLMNNTKNVAEFKRVQSVWLRAALDMPVEQIAQATGLAPNSVRCYHSRYLKQGESVLLGLGRGGRRRQNLSVAQESELLSSFEAQALQGGVLEVREIRQAYEHAVGHTVAKSTVYRMLARHGWRKVAPRPHHPKGDRARQQEFKKNSLRSSGRQ